MQELKITLLYVAPLPRAVCWSVGTGTASVDAHVVWTAPSPDLAGRKEER